MLPPPPSSPLSSLPTSSILASLAPIRHSSASFTNWARTFHSKTIAIFHPRNVEEVRLVVELARREGRELRVMGSGHSPSDLACTDGYGVNVDKLNNVLEVDSLNSTFHSEGGIKLSSLNTHLSSHSLALSSLGSISDQTLSGALSTATHGSGVTFGNLSTFVTFLDLVLPLPDAPIVRVSRQEDEELFLSALCGLGCMGVIVGVGMRAEPVFKLEEELFSMKWEEFVRDDNWKKVAESRQHVRCWWFPQVGEIKISRLTRTSKALTPPPPILQSYFLDTFISKHYHALALSIARYFPSLLPGHARFMYGLVHSPGKWDWSLGGVLRALGWGGMRVKSVRSGVEGEKEEGGAQGGGEEERQSGEGWKQVTESEWRVDKSENIFNYDCGFPQYTYEGCVPYSRTSEVLHDLEVWQTKELNDPNGLRGHFPIEIRWTEQDDIWLSPTYGMRGTYIGAIQYRPYNLSVPYKKIFRSFENILLKHAGRPHWAKSHNCSKGQLEGMYERLPEWEKVRERVDPEGVLCNAYVKRHLLGRVGEDVDLRRYK